MITNDISNNGLLHALRKFNAKERYYLVAHFLGNRDFTPTTARIAELENVLKIPTGTFIGAADKFCAMDYHLDWLLGALELSLRNTKIGEVRDKLIRNILGNVQDIDLLLAFDTHDSIRYHLVIVEAKGVTSYSNKQLISKQERFGAIFGQEKKNYEDVNVYYVLAAPSPPDEKRLDEKIRNWGWEFIKLPIPHGLLKITRTEGEIPAKKGANGMINERKERKNKS